MRVMVKLRGLGLPLPESRKVAEAAAPSVVFKALADHREKTLGVDATPERAAEYLGMLEKETDGGYLYTLADLAIADGLFRHAFLESGKCSLIPTIDDDVMGEDIEAAGLVNLWASARVIAEAVPRPLFTLIMPSSFRSR